MQDKTLSQTLAKLNLSQLSFLLSSTSSLSSQPVSSNLIPTNLTILGKTTTVELPQSLQQMIVDKNLPVEKLLHMARQPRGYYLTDAKAVNNQLMFSNDKAQTIPIQTLRDGDYRVAITLKNEKMMLSLTPILHSKPLLLQPYSQPTSKTPTSNSMPTQVIAKPDSGVLFSQLIRLLNQPLSSIASASPTSGENASPTGLPRNSEPLATNKTDSNQLPARTAKELQTASTSSNVISNVSHGKQTETILAATSPQPNSKGKERQQLASQVSGTKALNLNQQAIPEPAAKDSRHLHRGLKQSIETLQRNELVNSQPSANSKTSQSLLTFLPLLSPRAVSMLIQPNTLQKELLDGVKALSINMPSNEPLSSQNSSLSILFRLLMGQKSLATSTKLPTEVARQVEFFATKLNLSNSLLSFLDKSQSVELISRLLSNMSLFQQSSSDNAQGTNWLFTLPYKIDERFEELEGQFEQQKNEDGSIKPSWRLQLKFNLSNGGLLISAQTNTEKLILTINTDTEALLNKINSHTRSLEKKLVQAGFTDTKIITKQSALPITLLPGEHFLVKIKA
ncbi:hypothetical protein [Shewanella waksmanii]|uniref:hypothetical protein n=1 Tax=Shewanella waksmanii TaxID=213783 RepID=UPI0037353577